MFYSPTKGHAYMCTHKLPLGRIRFLVNLLTHACVFQHLIRTKQGFLEPAVCTSLLKIQISSIHFSTVKFMADLEDQVLNPTGSTQQLSSCQCECRRRRSFSICRQSKTSRRRQNSASFLRQQLSEEKNNTCVCQSLNCTSIGQLDT